MAVEYSLVLATPTSARDVARIAHDIAGPPRAEGGPTGEGFVDAVLGGGTALRGGAYVKILAARPPWWSPDLTDLGVDYTVHVYSRLTTSVEWEPQVDEITRLVAMLLARVSGDALFTHNGDNIWLLRRGDDLVLDDRPHRWTPARVARFEQAHRFQRLEYPE